MESLGLHPSEMIEVIEDREVWRLNLKLLPHKSHGKAGNEERKTEELHDSSNSLATVVALRSF